jgi:hypothetical protein
MTFGHSLWEGDVLLATNRQRAGMLLNILQCSEPAAVAKNSPAKISIGPTLRNPGVGS